MTPQTTASFSFNAQYQIGGGQALEDLLNDATCFLTEGKAIVANIAMGDELHNREMETMLHGAWRLLEISTALIQAAIRQDKQHGRSGQAAEGGAA